MINIQEKFINTNQFLSAKSQKRNICARNNACDEFISTRSFKGIQTGKKTIAEGDDKISPQFKSAIKETATVSRTIKNKYDERYGKNNWEYISIGRSCKLIADALEMQGVKTHIIPISGLSYYGEGSTGLIKQKGFPKYRQYIYDKGLNPENINTSGKKYIFQDYENSGRSMKTFEEFIRSPEFGFDGQNIVFESINDILEETKEELAKSGVNTDSFLMNRLTLDNNMYSFKYFIGSERFSCEDLGKISEYKAKAQVEKEEEKIFKNELSKLLKP